MSANNIDILDILDDNVDLNDLNELGAVLHIGTHRVTISWAAKLMGKENPEPVIELTMSLLETLELQGDDAEKEHQKQGMKCSTIFKRDGNMSEGKLRAVLEKLSPAANGSTKAAEIIKATEGYECIVTTGKRAAKNKAGEDVTYFDLKDIAPV